MSESHEHDNIQTLDVGANSHQALSFVTTRRVGGEGKQEGGGGRGNERGCCFQKGIYGWGKRRTTAQAITLIIHLGHWLSAISCRSSNSRFPRFPHRRSPSAEYYSSRSCEIYKQCYAQFDPNISIHTPRFRLIPTPTAKPRDGSA